MDIRNPKRDGTLSLDAVCTETCNIVRFVRGFIEREVQDTVKIFATDYYVIIALDFALFIGVLFHTCVKYYVCP